MSGLESMDVFSGCLGFMELQRNVHISLNRNYVYVAVPKAANSTIKGLLQTAELRGIGFEVGNVHDRLASPLIAPFQLPDRRFLDVMSGDGFRRFTCVRNPISRLLSCYLDRVRAPRSVPHRQVSEALGREPGGEITFADFIESLENIEPRDMNEHYRPQTLLTCLDLISYHDILEFEKLDEQLPDLLVSLYGKRGAKLDTSANLSPKKTGADDLVAEYYTPELRKKVRELYVDDFERFGYDD